MTDQEALQLIEDNVARHRHDLTQLYRAAQNAQALGQAVADDQRKQLEDGAVFAQLRAALNQVNELYLELERAKERLYTLETAAHEVVSSMSRPLGYTDAVTLVDTVLLRQLERCVSSKSAETSTSQIEETRGAQHGT